MWCCVVLRVRLTCFRSRLAASNVFCDMEGTVAILVTCVHVQCIFLDQFQDETGLDRMAHVDCASTCPCCVCAVAGGVNGGTRQSCNSQSTPWNTLHSKNPQCGVNTAVHESVNTTCQHSTMSIIKFTQTGGSKILPPSDLGPQRVLQVIEALAGPGPAHLPFAVSTSLHLLPVHNTTMGRHPPEQLTILNILLLSFQADGFRTIGAAAGSSRCARLGGIIGVCDEDEFISSSTWRYI